MLDDQDRQDIRRMRSLFWAKVNGEITLAEMQAEVKKIVDRQLTLAEVNQ